MYKQKTFLCFRFFRLDVLILSILSLERGTRNFQIVSVAVSKRLDQRIGSNQISSGGKNFPMNSQVRVPRSKGSIDNIKAMTIRAIFS